MEGRLDEVYDEFGDGDGALFVLEEVNQAFPPSLHRGGDPVGGQLLLDLFRLPLLLRDVQLQELDVLRCGRCSLAPLAEVVEAQSRFNHAVNNIVGSDHGLLVEAVPLVGVVLLGGEGEGVVDRFFVEEVEEEDDEVEGVLPPVAQQLRHYFVKVLAYGLTSSGGKYIGVQCSILGTIYPSHHILNGQQQSTYHPQYLFLSWTLVWRMSSLRNLEWAMNCSAEFMEWLYLSVKIPTSPRLIFRCPTEFSNCPTTLYSHAYFCVR